MSTLLRTHNPDAVDDNAEYDRRRPYVSQSVVFWPRPGEGRSGRFQTAAIVTDIHDDDHVSLLIIWDADDFIQRRNVPRKTEQNNVNAWTFNEHDEIHYHPEQKSLLSWNDIDAAVKRIQSLEEEVVTLRNSIVQLKRKPRDAKD
jgi:hypothetical protein